MKRSPIPFKKTLIVMMAIPIGLAIPRAYLWIQESVVNAEAQPTETETHDHASQHRIIATSPLLKDIVTSRPYVCQVHSCRHIDIRAISSGYLEEIPLREGQAVKQGQVMFKILPTLYKAKYESEAAEAQLAQLEYNNTQRLVRDKVVSQQELSLAAAKVARANAKAELAKAELSFADIKAPFDGIIDRMHEQKGSLISEGDILTTLSDNSVMWVYFNVPETRYLEYQQDAKRDELQVELMLANGQRFDQPGHIGTIEADFNNETGNIAFRADFPNPNGLLRHGQTGTIVIRHAHPRALVIPQRATFEILAKKYVFVLDDAGIAQQTEIQIQCELDDLFVIRSGLEEEQKIVLEGVQQVRNGESITFDYLNPEEVLGHLKFQAE